MTYRELNRYFHIQQKIKSINAELEQLSYLTAANLNGMPRSTAVGDPVHSAFMKGEKLRQKLEFQKMRAVAELDKLNDFIESVEDVEIQVILQKRFVECKSYERIGDELFMERTTVSKKIQRFLNSIV